MFPATEPTASGLLSVSDEQQIYWETCGDDDGPPVLFLHGGPGSGCSVGSRRWFDPRYRAVLFDQRGCGRSRPLVDGDTDLSTNTTQHLIADIEALRVHLGVERWAVFGLSWGATLGLAYAHAHPERVTGLVLGLVVTTSAREVDWVTVDIGRIFPEAHDRFMGALPAHLRHLRPIEAYQVLLSDPNNQDWAADEWCAWEDVHVSLTPGHQPYFASQSAEFRLRFARLVTHYWCNSAFLDRDQLIDTAPALDGLPAVLVHGRLDVSSPLETAWRLARNWSTSTLVILEDAGHGGGPTLESAIIAGLRDIVR